MTNAVLTTTGAPSPENHAAILARSSTHAETGTVERQIADARVFARANGWAVQPQHVYVVQDTNGTAPLEQRGDLAALATAAANGEIKRVIVQGLDRLTRDPRVALDFIEALGRHEVIISSYATGDLIDARRIADATQEA
jgi:DNA invertase Pin-like site-specific DNA recombinase